jgi:hypothetical protein
VLGNVTRAGILAVVLVLRILFGVVGLLFVYVGALTSRAWRASTGEPRYVLFSVGGLAASRFLGGAAFIAGGIARAWQPVVVGAACLLLGNVAADVGRRRLKRHEA